MHTTIQCKQTFDFLLKKKNNNNKKRQNKVYISSIYILIKPSQPNKYVIQM